MSALLKYGQYLVDDNPRERVILLPTLPATVDEANMLYGSTFSNCVRKTDLDNMTNRWLSHSANCLKRGKKTRELLSGNLICDLYVSKSSSDSLNHLELTCLLQSLVGTVIVDINDICLYRVRVETQDEDSEAPYVVGYIRDRGTEDLDELIPNFTKDFVETILARLRPVE